MSVATTVEHSGLPIEPMLRRDFGGEMSFEIGQDVGALSGIKGGKQILDLASLHDLGVGLAQQEHGGKEALKARGAETGKAGMTND